MEIILKVTIPDSDVTAATERTSGPEGDLSEWLVDFFQMNDREYLRYLGLERLVVKVVDVN